MQQDTPSPISRTVPTRRMDFEASFADVPVHFAHDGDLIASHLLAALSGNFPDGEEFFVRSVRRFRDRISDPELKRQVAGFIGQEAVHGREHRAFNDRLDALGYPTKRYERVTRRRLARRERLLGPTWSLAATAALEHFTATLAELVLTSEEIRFHLGHPAVRDLYVWHSLEESEHKSVAFDVYKSVGGSERTRVWTMNMLTAEFIVGTAVQVVVSLLGDPATYRPRVLRDSWRGFRQSSLADAGLWRRLRDYNRTDFHPTDHDTVALVAEWRDRLFGSNGTLNELLATAAS